MEWCSFLAVMYNMGHYYYVSAPQASTGNAGYYYITQDKQMNLIGVYQVVAPYYGNLQHVVHPANGGGRASVDHPAGRCSRETLELFPLRPTFALPDSKSRAAASPPPSAASTSFSGGESESLAENSNSNAEALPFHDFLGLQSKGR
jgi:hypothetical protein